MPIIQAGRSVTPQEFKNNVGDVIMTLRNVLNTASNLGGYLTGVPDQDLIDFGLTEEEVGIIKGSLTGEIPALVTLFYDSVWMKRLIGLNV